jgi:MFS family permease
MERRHWIILLALLAAVTVSAIEGVMVVMGVPRWIQIHGDPVAVGWLVSAFLVVQAAAAVLGGRLGDMFGRRRVLVWSLVICSAGSVWSGVAGSLERTIVGRAIQGAAGAILPLCYGLVRELLPADRMCFGISAMIASAALSSGLGMVAGGMLIDSYGPQSIFFAIAGAGVIALACVLLGIPAATRIAMPQRLDWTGGLLFVPGTALLLLGVSRVEQDGLSTIVAAFLLGGSAILFAWLLHELRQAEPMVDVRLLGKRDIALANTVMTLSAIGVMQTPLVLSMLIQQPVWTGVGLGQSATLVGWLTLPSLLIATLVSLVTGRIADRVGTKVPMMAGCAIASGAVLAAIFWHDSLLVLAGILVVVVVGNAVVYACVPMVVVSVAPDDRVSEATGFTAVLRGLAGAAGMQVLALLLATSTIAAPEGKALPDQRAFAVALAAMALCSLLALGAAAALSRSQGRLALGRSPVDGDPSRQGAG